MTRPLALFYALFMSAVVLGVAEAIHLVLQSSESLDVTDSLLGALYSMSPFAVGGLALATTAAGLAELWRRARRASNENSGEGRGTDLTAAAIALLAFAGVLFLAARLILARTHHRALGAATLAFITPIAVIGTIYLWALLRNHLAGLNRRLGRKGSAIAGTVFIAMGVGFPVAAVMSNEALAERLGGWSALFCAAYPVLAIAFTYGFGRWSVRSLGGLGVRRAVMAVGVVSLIGTTDLVYNMDARGPVKDAILSDTLVLATMILFTQPLFDGDHDGHAGLLGGGDCDDDDPAVHPGATEIPRNSVDDDCFGGDSPGDYVPRPGPVQRPKMTVDVRRPRLVRRPNIMLITIDTLRADHLGYHGYPRPVSPNLDAFAQQSVRFMWAFAQGPQTKSSIPSMMTGRYFSEVERSPGNWAAVHPENHMLAEYLQEVGYHTAGIVSHRFFVPTYGLNQGFEDWDLSVVRRYHTRIPHYITGGMITDRALAWLKGRGDTDRPFFLWLHYFDPHFAYKDHPDIDFGPSDLDRYDEEIRYSDTQVGKVLDYLASSPISDRTYVMVHSDHGEAFGTHGYSFHGQHLYNDQVHVPLMVYGPGLHPRQVDEPVGLIDVAPTVLQLAGVPKPEQMHGDSLIPYGGVGPVKPHGPVFVEMVKDPTHSDRRVIIDWPFKLQYGITFNQYTLHNLAQDPDELDDISSSRPEAFARLQQRMRHWMSREVNPVAPRR